MGRFDLRHPRPALRERVFDASRCRAGSSSG
jgi:hypothetical protein